MEPVKVRIATAAPRRSPWGEVLLGLARRLERDAKDASGRSRLEVRIDWQVPSELRALKACDNGRTAGVAVSFSALATRVPELAAIELPFLFDSDAAVDRAMQGAYSSIARLLGARGLVLALRLELGFSHWASRTSFLARPETFAGRALHARPGGVGRSIYAALGALPTEDADVPDVATRLAAGALDGYDQSLVFARLAKWSEHIRFVTLSAHAYEAGGLVWCGAWLDALPDELEALLTRRDVGIEELERSGLELTRHFNRSLMPRMYERAGIAVRALDDEERAALKSALTGIEAQFVAGTSAEGRALLTLLTKPGR